MSFFIEDIGHIMGPPHLTLKPVRISFLHASQVQSHNTADQIALKPELQYSEYLANMKLKE